MPENKKQRRENELRQEILDALASSPQVSLVAVTVEVHDETKVRLSGLVDTLEQKEAIEDITRYTDGVSEVENHLVVMEPTPTGLLPNLTNEQPPVQ